MASDSVKPQAWRRRLIDGHQGVLDSGWGKVQPKAGDAGLTRSGRNPNVSGAIDDVTA
jgi:hypothetical protein